MTKAAKLTRLVLVLAAAPCALLLAGCGESESEKFEKAKAEVCKSRSAIEKQVESLKSLPLDIGSIATAKTGLETIEKEIKKIKEQAPKLKPEAKSQVEKSTSQFTGEVTKIAETLGTSLTPSNVVKQVEEATRKLLTSYQSTLQTLSCS
jgi:ABC-type Zn uptake system ZnuABC Zn-binding protein ZnuA